MIAKLIISPSLETRKEEIYKILLSHLRSGRLDLQKHPDLLYIGAPSKLGIEQARKIKEHFSLKSYQGKGRVVVLEDASLLTHDAQNALLKTLEETPGEGVLILGASSEAKFLPTVLSRCQITRINPVIPNPEFGLGEESQDLKSVEKLLNSSLAERFEYVEKLKDREALLHSLVSYYHQNLKSNPKKENLEFTKELLQAEEWANQNVNIRAILEYLMLVMPSDRSPKQL